jgi:hypothetical protein
MQSIKRMILYYNSSAILHTNRESALVERVDYYCTVQVEVVYRKRNVLVGVKSRDRLIDTAGQFVG